MELKNKPYRIAALSRAILYKLYVEHVNDRVDQRFSVEDVVSLFSSKISKNLVQSALEYGRRGAELQFLLRSVDKDSGYHVYHLSTEGMMLVERELQRKNSDIAYYAIHGDDGLDEVAGLNGAFQTANDRNEIEIWDQIDIDLEDKAYKKALSAVENALNAIREDNQFAIEYPRERDSILRALEGGLDRLKQPKINRHGVISSIVEPLRAFMGFVGKAAASVLARDAITTVLTWLGNL